MDEEVLSFRCDETFGCHTHTPLWDRDPHPSKPLQLWDVFTKVTADQRPAAEGQIPLL